MVERNLHRIYVVRDRKPVGVGHGAATRSSSSVSDESVRPAADAARVSSPPLLAAQVITLTDILRLFAVDPRSPAAGEWLTWAQQQAPVAAEQEKRGVEETREALLGRTVAAGEGAGA